MSPCLPDRLWCPMATGPLSPAIKHPELEADPSPTTRSAVCTATPPHVCCHSACLLKGRSMDFPFDLILPATLRPWGWLSLWQKWVLGIFLGRGGGKRGRRIELTTSPPFVRRFSSKCGILDVKLTYRPAHPVTGTALLLLQMQLYFTRLSTKCLLQP
jgi:hypothetical protein